MDYNTLQKNKTAIEGFINFAAWQNPVALNLTFRQCIWPQPYFSVRVDEIAASGNVKHFFNVLNCKLLNRNERRHGGRIGSFAVFERDEETRLHCHALVECPDPAMFDYFQMLVATRWPQTTWGYRQTVVKPCDEGWLDYMTKFRTKANYLSAHDWTVIRLPKKKES